MSATIAIIIQLVAGIGVFSITESILQPNDSNMVFAVNDSAEYGDEQNDQTMTGNTRSVDDTATGYEDSFLVLNVLANDRKEIYGYEDSISIQSVTNPSFGTVTVSADNTIAYIPNGQRLPSGSIVSDSFEYFAVVHNSGGDINYDATVRLQIKQINDVPVVFDSSYSVSNNRILSSYLPVYDEDGDRLSFSIVSRPELGEIIYFDPTTGRFQYAPYNNSAGYDSFTYITSDGISNSNFGTVTITVLDSMDNESDDSWVTEEEAVVGDDGYGYYDDYYYNDGSSSGGNDTSSQSPPIEGEEYSGPIAKASAKEIEVFVGEPVTLDGKESYDPDGDSLTYSWSQTGGPKVSLSSSSSASAFFIAPTANAETILTFELVVSDGHATSDPSTIAITVFPAPVIQIDILPRVYSNEINTNKVKANIPVAVLGSDSVDISNIDQSSLEFGPNSATPTSISLQDSNDDGFYDLVAYFNIEELGLKASDTEACMTGSLSVSSRALSFEACDSVKIVNKN